MTMDESHKPLTSKPGTKEEEIRKKNRLILSGKFFMYAFLGLIVLQLYNVTKTIERAQQLAKSPIAFGEYIPDKSEYHPGEVIHFTYVRHTMPTPEQPLPILILQLDSFENIDTGEVFQGVMASRIIKKAGSEQLTATRVLPEEMSPGTYIFEGWASSQVSRLSRATAYASKPFSVKSKPFVVKPK